MKIQRIIPLSQNHFSSGIFSGNIFPIINPATDFDSANTPKNPPLVKSCSSPRLKPAKTGVKVPLPENLYKRNNSIKSGLKPRISIRSTIVAWTAMRTRIKNIRRIIFNCYSIQLNGGIEIKRLSFSGKIRLYDESNRAGKLLIIPCPTTVKVRYFLIGFSIRLFFFRGKPWYLLHNLQS